MSNPTLVLSAVVFTTLASGFGPRSSQAQVLVGSTVGVAVSGARTPATGLSWQKATSYAGWIRAHVSSRFSLQAEAASVQSGFRDGQSELRRPALLAGLLLGWHSKNESGEGIHLDAGLAMNTQSNCELELYTGEVGGCDGELGPPYYAAEERDLRLLVGFGTQFAAGPVLVTLDARSQFGLTRVAMRRGFSEPDEPRRSPQGVHGTGLGVSVGLAIPLR